MSEQRLIDANALRAEVEKIKHTYQEMSATELGYDILRCIDNAPTVEPERSKGEWIDTGSGQECNVCHEIQYGYDNFRHFCTNCGAEMKGGTE